jgi:hypothetical protein
VNEELFGLSRQPKSPHVPDYMAVSIHGTLQVFGHNGLKLASQLPVVSALRFH